ncbi:hypothetical protein [Ferruginibacter profundus]
MMNITFYNTSRRDKTEKEWFANVGQGLYKAAGSRHKVDDEDYLAIITKVIPDKLKLIPFWDIALTTMESENLLNEFGTYIEMLIAKRPKKIVRQNVAMFRGKEIKMHKDEDLHIKWAIKTYTLIEKCLRENKPVYLSIEEESN